MENSSVDVNSVVVKRYSKSSVSNFHTGISQVDNSLDFPWGFNNQTAVNNAKSLIQSGISFMNQFIQAWAAPDIWPDPTNPDPTTWDWNLLDSQMQKILDSGATPVISLAEAPWWMKGQLQADGTTKLIPDVNGEWTTHIYTNPFVDYRVITYPAGYVSPDSYSCRILDNQIGNWTHLVMEIAKRYMVAPYNVRYFQVWNELKGYYNPTLNRWDYENNPGDPSGYNAQSGYTYMYNQVYDAVMSAAASLGIPANSFYIGGPYVCMDTWPTPIAGGWPSQEPNLTTKAYGTYDRRPIDVVKYWLQNKNGAGFITIDGSIFNKDNVELTDSFTASEKFADVTKWIRSLDNTVYPGARTLPIWWAEWYAWPYTDFSDAHNNAVKTYAMVKLLKQGCAVPLEWGASISTSGNDFGLWTPTNAAGGGQALPWYNSYKALHDYFGAGTPLCIAIVSNPSSIEVLSSKTRTMLINKTPNTYKVYIKIYKCPFMLPFWWNTIKMTIALSPYEVKIVSY